MYRPRILLALASLALLSFATLQAQVSLLRQMTTPERVKTSEWWPTKILTYGGDYTGPKACGGCHRDISDSQPKSEMARTLSTASASPIVDSHKRFTLGPYTYDIARAQNDVNMTVSDGSRSLTAPLTWAIGVGRTGQSYLWEHDGTFFESRFNYFGAINAFDATPGRMRAAPDTLESAVGRAMSEPEVRSCLVCHATAVTTERPIQVQKLIPGVTCEACHGPGANHVELERSGVEQRAPLIMNPKRLTPQESVDFCGSCHGTFWDAELGGATGPATARFPAYRLEKSHCWGRAGDARLTCVSCHDPHRPLVRETASYDKVCLGCHSKAEHAVKTTAAPKTCRVANRDCASCHMPKVEVKEMQNTFTDHRIRIARAGAAFAE